MDQQKLGFAAQLAAEHQLRRRFARRHRLLAHARIGRGLAAREAVHREQQNQGTGQWRSHDRQYLSLDGRHPAPASGKRQGAPTEIFSR
ncbi:hypothetical protein D3C86_2052840 [compost metagenome]